MVDESDCAAVGAFDTLHESPENEELTQRDHTDSKPASALSDNSLMRNGTTSADSEFSGNRSDEKSDKENHDPDPSVLTCHLCFVCLSACVSAHVSACTK